MPIQANTGHSGDHRRFLRAAAVAMLATVLFAAGLTWAGETSVLYVSDIGTVLAALTATVLCLRAGILAAGQLRRSWWLLAAASGAWTTAEVTWGVYKRFLHQEVPVPSWADVGYLTGMALAAAALLAHPASSCPLSAVARTRQC